MKFHFYEIVIDGKYIYRVLNTVKKIHLRNISNQENKTSFLVDSEDIEETLRILKANDIPVLNMKEKGIYTKIVDKFFFKLVLIFAFVFVTALIVCSRYIWEISIDGNYTYTTNTIKNFVYSQKIKEGTLKKTSTVKRWKSK